MSTDLAELVERLNRDGYEAWFNAEYGTIDIVRVDGRPLLDPWPLEISPSHLHAVLTSVAHREQVGRSESFALLAAMIESDVETYESADGPFALDKHGYVTRRPAE